MNGNRIGKPHIELLESMIIELDNIESLIPSQDSELMKQSFIRWRDRSARLISDSFGKDESQKLSRIEFPRKSGYLRLQDMLNDTHKPFKRSRALLQSLLEEIKEHGEHYYDGRALTQTPTINNHQVQGAKPNVKQEDSFKKVSSEEDFEKVTLAWLFHRVPAKFWVWLSGILIAFFIVGITFGQFKSVKELYNWKDDSTQHTLQLSPEELKGKIDQLIQGHNERATKIQAAILDEEKLAGDHNLPPYYQDTHSRAAQKLRADLASENEVFLKDVRELQSLEK